MNRTFAAALACSGFLATSGVALADVAPPREYSERCTVERLEDDASECRTCETNYRNPPDHCGRVLGEDFNLACRGAGSSTWTEVWCRPKPGTPAGDEKAMSAAPRTTSLASLGFPYGMRGALASAGDLSPGRPSRQRCSVGGETTLAGALGLAIAYVARRARRARA